MLRPGTRSSRSRRRSPARFRAAANDLATIIYTSGSTGVPKGVMHSFETMISPGQRFTEYFELRTSDRMLSYLPLAHAFERYVVETGTIGKGFHVFFAESLDTFVEDISARGPRCSSACRACGRSSSWGCSRRCPSASSAPC